MITAATAISASTNLGSPRSAPATAAADAPAGWLSGRRGVAADGGAWRRVAARGGACAAVDVAVAAGGSASAGGRLGRPRHGRSAVPAAAVRQW